MLNCFKDYKRCIHISHYILDFVKRKKIKFSMKQSQMVSLIYCQHHACWSPSDLRSRGINKHGIGLKKPEYSFLGSIQLRFKILISVIVALKSLYGKSSFNRQRREFFLRHSQSMSSVIWRITGSSWRLYSSSGVLGKWIWFCYSDNFTGMFLAIIYARLCWLAVLQHFADSLGKACVRQLGFLYSSKFNCPVQITKFCCNRGLFRPT